MLLCSQQVDKEVTMGEQLIVLSKSRRVGGNLAGRFLPAVLLVWYTWPVAGKPGLPWVSSQSWAAQG